MKKVGMSYCVKKKPFEYVQCACEIPHHDCEFKDFKIYWPTINVFQIMWKKWGQHADNCKVLIYL